MKKIIIRILTLAAIFVLAVVGFYWYLNQGTTDTTETMAEATFPLVYMKNGDSLLNCLHGYTQEMDVTAMRDTLTPLENDKMCIRDSSYRMWRSSHDAFCSSDQRICRRRCQRGFPAFADRL